MWETKSSSTNLTTRLSKPHHDDVVVFLAPPAATEPGGLPPDSEFIKRLIGLPGDRLEVVGGHLSINGTLYNHAEVRQKLTQEGVCGPDATADLSDESQLQADCHVKFVADGVLVLDNQHHSTLVGKPQLAQMFTTQKDMPVTIRPGYLIRNGVKVDEPFIAEDPDYDMKIYQGEPLKHDYGYGANEGFFLASQSVSPSDYQKEAALPTEPLPAGQYMMMGDNRNDSSDSTHWGPLDAHRLVGKAQLIFWPPSRIGLIH